jgi:hypothetical protein
MDAGLTHHGAVRQSVVLATVIFSVTLPEIFSGKKWLELAKYIVK